MKAIFKKRSLRDYEVTFGANVFGFITQVNESWLLKIHVLQWRLNGKTGS
jgi:hypothetical protein